MSSPPFVARTPEQVRLLLNLTSAPALTVLMGGEASVGEVAQATQLTVKQAYHRLSRLHHAGLIEVTGERLRAGRPVKVYRAAPAYQVPFALTDAATLEDWLRAIHRPFLDAYLRARAAGYGSEQSDSLFIVLDSHGHMSRHFGRAPGWDTRHPGYGTVRTTTLRPEAMQELQARLQALGEWVTAQSHEGDPQARACILALLFTPGEVEGL